MPPCNAISRAAQAAYYDEFQRGFNLLELSIALFLSLVVLAGLSAVFVSTNRVNQTQSALRDVHFSGVYGLDILTEEIRRAGFARCLDIDNIQSVPSPADAPNQAVWGAAEDGTDEGMM